MRIKLLTAAVVSATVLLTSGVARANWVHILNSYDGDKLLVGNMWKEGNLVHFWEAIIPPGENRPVAKLISADCKTSQYQIQQMTDGVNTDNSKSAIKQATAGSLIAVAINYACAETN